jgi:hypothetical protein
MFNRFYNKTDCTLIYESGSIDIEYQFFFYNCILLQMKIEYIYELTNIFWDSYFKLFFWKSLIVVTNIFNGYDILCVFKHNTWCVDILLDARVK